MTLEATITWNSRDSTSISMDSAADKEERKREYNRLAQREFRRRRKEHLKNLEKAQKDQNSEQSEEIERLLFENTELRRENEALKSQMYGPSSSQSMISTPLNAPSTTNDSRIYSPSPSVSGASIPSSSSPQQSLVQEMMTHTTLTSTVPMLQPSMQTYTDPSGLTQPYSMVHPSVRRHNSHSSPELSGFRSSPSSVAMGSQFQSLSMAQHSSEAQTTHPLPFRRRSSSQARLMVMTPYDNNKARAELHGLFQPLFADPNILTTPQRHLAVLRSMTETLPQTLRPSQAQTEVPHYYGIDMMASPALRERLMTLNADIAQRFLTEIGITSTEGGNEDPLLIWGEPLNEMSWEFSQTVLQRWAWLLGSEWIVRANFWRRQRGAPLLADW